MAILIPKILLLMNGCEGYEIKNIGGKNKKNWEINQ